jgi:uncharacterized protein (DUF58 family)
MIASRALYLILLAVAALFCTSVFWPGAMRLGLFCDAFIICLLLTDHILTPRPGAVTGERTTAERLSIGRNNLVKLSVNNTSARLLTLRVKDDGPNTLTVNPDRFEFKLDPASKADLQYWILPNRRGIYEFGNIYVRYKSALGFFWRESKCGHKQKFKVYPDLQGLNELSLQLRSSSELGELRQNKRGQGTDFSGLKEYVIGDDSRRIDWKATARREKPIVRSYEIEQEQRLLVLVDAGRMMISDLEGLTRFDHALNAALALVLAGLSYNDQVGLGIFADKPLLYLPPRRGKDYLQKMLEGVFSVNPVMVEPDYPAMLAHFGMLQKGRSLVVVLTDLTDPTGSQALSTGLCTLRKRHLPFCVTLNDRQVVRTSQYRVDGKEEGIESRRIFERAVAVDLLGQRELTLNLLQRQGCLVLDKPPQELSSAIVERYLDIKRRGLI